MAAKKYQPPFTLSSEILTLAVQISEEVGQFSVQFNRVMAVGLAMSDDAAMIAADMAICKPTDYSKWAKGNWTTAG